jgi:membrane protease YdiL (CAAX protease family)
MDFSDDSAVKGRDMITTRKTVLQILGAMLLPYVGIALVLGGATIFGVTEQILSGGYGPRMLANAAAGAIIILMLLPYAAAMGSVPLRSFAFTWGDRDLLAILLGTAATLGLAWVYIVGLDWLGVRTVSAVTPVWALVALGFIGHAGTFFEEVLFRGYVLTRLRRAGVGRAILISALLFCIGHIPVRGVSPLILTWLLGGLVYGYLYVKSGSLWVTGGFHLAHNVAGDLFLYSDNGVALVRFAGPLGLIEKTGFELLLSGLVLLLTLLVYGRGTHLLEAAPHLQAGWDELDAVRPAARPLGQPVPRP